MTTSNRSDGAGWLLVMILTTSLSILGVGQASLYAQQPPTSLVVPLRYATTEAPNAVFWAVSPFPARRQLLIYAAHLTAARNRTLKGLRVRRNGGDRDTLPAGYFYLEVSLSENTRSAAAADVRFAANRGSNPVQVFRGRFDLPESPAPRVTPAPWATPFSVRLPFATAYVYGGGTLCVETVTSTAGPWWPLDGLRQNSAGKVLAYGNSCIPRLSGHPAGADAASQNLGSSAVVFLRGTRTQGSGLLLLGLDNKTIGAAPLPLDLASFGAPGCSLLLNPMVMAPIALAERPGGQGHVAVAIAVPYDVRLPGVSYYTQWLLREPGHNSLGLTFSNGVAATIGPYKPPLGITWIESTDLAAATGRILAGRTPVLRFDL
jgi:hypothetical protein